MRGQSKGLMAIALAGILLWAPSLHAFWMENGEPICTAPGDQYNVAMVSDGSGGAIIAWIDQRAGSDIYAQRINAAGRILWPSNGIPLCTIRGRKYSLAIASDGAGGAIAAWSDQRSLQYDIYAQRIGSAGNVMWAASGVPVCTAAYTQNYPTIMSDGSGGAVVAWADSRKYLDYDIYAQKVSGSGEARWATDGVALCEAPKDQDLPTVVSDGTGGAIVAWRDGREPFTCGIYAQRATALGEVAWTTNGVLLSGIYSAPGRPALLADGAGGAMAAWTADVFFSDVLMQRVGSSGDLLWPSNGVSVCMALEGQFNPMLVHDGAGGAIVAWDDWRGPRPKDIYAQRITGAGQAMWATNGVPVCEAGGDQSGSVLVSDDRGGAIVAWMDNRSGDYNVYVQKVRPSGEAAWTRDGVSLCSAAGNQSYPVICSDGAHGAFIAWQDERSGEKDVYAASVPGAEPPLLVRVDIRPASCPNPFNPKSKGVLPVAILGTASFDVRAVAPKRVFLEGVPALRWSFEDVAAPPLDDSECACSPTGPDGRVDLVFKFDAQAIAAALQNPPPGSTRMLLLTGEMQDGGTIVGRDCVRIVGEGARDPWSPRPPAEPEDPDAPKGRKERIELGVALRSSPGDRVQRVSYSLPEPAAAEIAIFDVSGRLVQRFERRFEPAGAHTRDWDTAGLASGIYFCRVRAASFVETKKILIVR